MNLNNATRKDLALKLAVMAMAKHSAGLGRLAKLISDGFRQHHIDLLQKAVPEVPQARWAELIQLRIVQPALNGNCFFKQEGQEKPTLLQGDPVTNFGTSKEEEDRRLAFGALLSHLGQTHTGFRSALALFDLYDLRRQRAGRLQMDMASVPDLPDVNGRRTLDVRYPGQAALLKNANALIARLGKILAQGFDYMEEVQDLLAGIRTDKQLQDLFPEAAKLLPPPPPPRSDIAPVELARKVRQRLVDGVPED